MIGSLQSDAQHAVQAIDDGKNQAHESVELTQQVHHQVSEITKIVIELSEINEHISNETREQDVLLEQASGSLEQLVSLADEAADSTEQSATMTLDIEAQMSSLKQAVDRFKV